MSDAQIVVSAVVFRDSGGRVLTVRKSGTAKFMFPGGKLEPGESAADAAVREVGEELDIRVRTENLRLLGVFTSAVANEADHTVTATVYEHPYVSVTEPAGEIAELRWVDPVAEVGTDIAPLLADEVFPALLGAGRR